MCTLRGAIARETALLRPRDSEAAGAVEFTALEYYSPLHRRFIGFQGLICCRSHPVIIFDSINIQGGSGSQQ